MYSIIYRSVADESFDEAHIHKMLIKARNFNAEHNITGCLLYHKTIFIQLIEGDKDVVTNLYHRIQIDARHTDVKALISEEIEERIFAKWDMAFQDLGEEGLHKIHKMVKLQKLFEESNLYSKTSAADIKSEPGMILFKSVLEILND